MVAKMDIWALDFLPATMFTPLFFSVVLQGALTILFLGN
jgi:hypothetical protein